MLNSDIILRKKMVIIVIVDIYVKRLFLYLIDITIILQIL